MELVFLLFLLPVLVMCKIFELSQGYGTVLQPESSAYPMYLLTNNSHAIVSDNRKFSLGADISRSFGTYGLLTSLNILMNGSDMQGSAISVFSWDFNAFAVAGDNIRAVELKDTGNLLLHFYQDSLKPWESFDYVLSQNGRPVLLPGQYVRSGIVYQPEESGLSMGAWQWNGMLWNFQSKCNISQRPELHYTGTQLEFLGGCDTFSLSTSNLTKPILPYLGLDSNGELASYRYDEVEKTWIQEFLLSSIYNPSWGDIYSERSRPLCETEVPCREGSLGVCNGSGQCSCIQSKRRLAVKCESTNLCYSYSQYTGLHGETYYYMNGRLIIKPDITNSSFEDCRNACEQVDCSICQTVFYNNLTRDCILIPAWDSGKKTPLFFLSFHDSRINYQEPFDFKRLVLIIPVLVVVFWMVAICSLGVVKLKLDDNPEKEIEALLASMQGLPKRYSYTALEVATKGFSIKLGEGGFGSVYKGVLTDGRVVAVKKLNSKGTDGAKQFVTEVAGIGGISHVNIVTLCGFCIEGATQWLLVYEFMPNGSLDQWLFQGENHLTWEQRILIALGTAQGLAYLHEGCSQPILHLDIKPQNILLDEKLTVKLADFGMAKCLDNPNLTEVLTCVRGTPGYMAPEWLTNFSATKKTDVFSYGMVLLELIGGRRNFDGSLSEEETYFPDWVVNQMKQGNALSAVDGMVREQAREKIQEVSMMFQLALWCIQHNPKARPSMQTVVEVLQGHLQLDVLLSLGFIGTKNNSPPPFTSDTV